MSENESNQNSSAVPHRRGKAGRRDEFAERLGPKLYRAVIDHARTTRESAPAIWARFRLGDLGIKPRTLRNRITIARRQQVLDTLETPLPTDIRRTLDARAAARAGELLGELLPYFFPGLRDAFAESFAASIGRALVPLDEPAQPPAAHQPAVPADGAPRSDGPAPTGGGQ